MLIWSFMLMWGFVELQLQTAVKFMLLSIQGKVKIRIKLDQPDQTCKHRTLRNTEPILFKLGSNLADEMFISKNLKENLKNFLIKKLIFN